MPDYPAYFSGRVEPVTGDVTYYHDTDSEYPCQAPLPASDYLQVERVKRALNAKHGKLA